MSKLRNLNLEVAQFALNSVKDVKDEENAKKYKTLVKKMPVLIQKNGLVGTLVFNLSKIEKEKQHELVLNQIKEWCMINFKLEFIREKLEVNKEKEDNTDFILKITELSPLEYRLVTKEMMILFSWIKRFADGMIEGEDNNE